MALSIPSLQDLLTRTRQAFSSNLPGTNAAVFPSNLYVSAKVIAAKVWELYARLAFIESQAFIPSASGIYLDRHGAQWGVVRRNEIAASGSVNLTGGTHLTAIPTGTLLQRDDGVQFATTEDAFIASDGTATLEVEAQISGPDGNTDGTETLSFVAAIVGAPLTGTVAAAGLVNGADIEGDDSYRERILTVLQSPPSAGTEADYARWTLEVPGVTRVWVSGRALGPGTVLIYFAMDDAYADGVPQATDVANVQAYLDSVRPVTANVTVVAPAPLVIPINITGLSPTTAVVIENVRNEIEQLFLERAEVSTPTNGQTFYQSWVWQAVSNATGERFHNVSAPAADVTIDTGFLPVYDAAAVTIS